MEHPAYQPSGSDAAAALKADNEVTLYHLVRQLRTSVGVIPFVGAGMSTPFGFPAWAAVLRQAAQVEGVKTSGEVDRLLAAGDYEGAAEHLRSRGEDNFQRRIEKEYGRAIDGSEAGRGALTLLPLLCSGPVITTNFDHVLEAVFQHSGAPFAERILGPEPDRILKAIHGSARVLIKMHGDCEDRKARSFTTKEYDLNYGSDRDGSGGGSRAGLGSLVRLMFTSRPLLFMGCSLETDRTVKILQTLHQELAALTHYAIVEASADPAKFEARRKALLDMGISPLWFPHGDFARIGTLLEDLVFGMSVRRMPRAAAAPAASAAKAQPVPKAPVEAWDDVQQSDPDAAPHFERVARLILDGRVTFVLGVGAHLGAFDLAGAFYQRLATRFGCPEFLGVDRSAVARHIADRFGRDVMWDAVRTDLSRKVTPSLVYRFLASLPNQLRAEDRFQAPPQVIITTNQDGVLEQAFEEAGEPFHLFYYCGNGPYEGLFVHRAPEGSVQVIDRPENIRALSPQTIIVKLNGGAAYPDSEAWPESAVIARGDYAKLASRIPGVLPAVVRRAISSRSLLFLGHGLREQDVEELVRFCAGPNRTLRSWAIKWQPKVKQLEESVRRQWEKEHKEDAAYWAHCGLEVRLHDLASYVPQLRTALKAALHRDSRAGAAAGGNSTENGAAKLPAAATRPLVDT